MFPKPTF